MVISDFETPCPAVHPSRFTTISAFPSPNKRGEVQIEEDDLCCRNRHSDFHSERGSTATAPSGRCYDLPHSPRQLNPSEDSNRWCSISARAPRTRGYPRALSFTGDGGRPRNHGGWGIPVPQEL